MLRFSFVKGALEMDGSLIKQMLDFFIIFVFECVEESWGDGQGELKVEVLFSFLNFLLINLKGFKSFVKREIQRKMIFELTLMILIIEFVNSCFLVFGCQFKFNSIDVVEGGGWEG